MGECSCWCLCCFHFFFFKSCALASHRLLLHDLRGPGRRLGNALRPVLPWFSLVLVSPLPSHRAAGPSPYPELRSQDKQSGLFSTFASKLSTFNGQSQSLCRVHTPTSRSTPWATKLLVCIISFCSFPDELGARKTGRFGEPQAGKTTDSSGSYLKL